MPPGWHDGPVLPMRRFGEWRRRRARDRRARPLGALLLVLGLVAALGTGCDRDFSTVDLTLATGGTQGVYYKLGGALAHQWHAEFDMPRARILSTAGSVDNIERLRGGSADVVFSAADAAADAVRAETASHPGRRIRALARIYDDYLHVVVRADSPVHRLADLRGLRVSTGSPSSGVELIAHRLLHVAGLDPHADLQARRLGIDDSIDALRDGTIDAFFWSGGLPTPGISALSEDVPLRLVDLSDVLPELQRRYPVYQPATIPATEYRLRHGPVTTLVVPNYLLVTDAMPDDVASTLLRGLFDGQRRLVRANPAALSIDVHSAIDTSPVPLHAGARAYYRSRKL